MPAWGNKTFLPGLVSVVIPCRNGEAYLEECLNSALDQTYADFEIIVIDNRSTDRSVAIARTFGEKVRVVAEDRIGLSRARNRGLSEAQGEYIQFLDCDDLLHPEKLRKQVEYLQANRECGVVYSRCQYFNDVWPSKLYPVRFIREARDLIAALFAHNIMPVHAALTRRSVIESIGLYDETMPALEDWDYWYRAAKADVRFKLMNESLCYYRRRAAQMTKAGALMARGRNLLLRKMREDFPDLNDSPVRLEAMIETHLNLLDYRESLAKDGFDAKSIHDLTLGWFEKLSEQTRSAPTPATEIHPLSRALMSLKLAVHFPEAKNETPNSYWESGLTEFAKYLESFEPDDIPDYLGYEVLRLLDRIAATTSKSRLLEFDKLFSVLLQKCSGFSQWDELRLSRQSLDMILKVEKLAGRRRIVLFGDRQSLARLPASAQWADLEIIGVICADPVRIGEKIFGTDAITPEECLNRKPDAVLMLLPADKVQSDIEQILEGSGIALISLFSL
jgi:glycosyltransferase involved in cell wall biosynthesis